MINTTKQLFEKFFSFAIINDSGEIIGFDKNITKEAQEAALEYFEICEKSDDVSNFQYWENLKDMVYKNTTFDDKPQNKEAEENAEKFVEELEKELSDNATDGHRKDKI